MGEKQIMSGLINPSVESHLTVSHSLSVIWISMVWVLNYIWVEN